MLGICVGVKNYGFPPSRAVGCGRLDAPGSAHSLHKQLLHGARDKDSGEGRVVLSPALQL